jgi:hypothetical protein
LYAAKLNFFGKKEYPFKVIVASSVKDATISSTNGIIHESDIRNSMIFDTYSKSFFF